MEFDEIEDELNDPRFKIDPATLLMKIHSENRMNGYRLQAILEIQLKVPETLHGKTGQELDTTVQSKLEELNNRFSEWLQDDIIEDLDDINPNSP
jgi:hypothetical protein